MDAPRYHVPGPGQAIRMKTWNDVNGYWPMHFGGEDVAIYIAAWMHGWTSRNDPNLLITLRRRTGAGGGQSPTRSMYERGMQDYDLGRSCWYEAARLTRRFLSAPVAVGAAARACGYLVAAVRRRRYVGPEFLQFLHEWEVQQLKAAIVSLPDRVRR